jgi:hypothetical protein
MVADLALSENERNSNRPRFGVFPAGEQMRFGNRTRNEKLRSRKRNYSLSAKLRYLKQDEIIFRFSTQNKHTTEH